MSNLKNNLLRIASSNNQALLLNSLKNKDKLIQLKSHMEEFLTSDTIDQLTSEN